MDDASHISHPASRAARHWPLPVTVALIALIAVIAMLDSSGAVPQLGEGPGLTLDETFNVQMGVYHIRAIEEYGVALLHPDSIKEVFGNPAYNPDHPPLGRVLIGIAHELTFPLLQPDVAPNHVCVTCGRIAAACGFALTILLIGWTTSRWYGRTAGVVASLSMVLMPRLVTHAHLASLETFVNLAYIGTVLWVAARWQGERPPRWRNVLIGGVLFGLCLLTKIQGVLLPIPIGLWALWKWRWRAVLPMFVFGLTGLAVFFVGWPWLWLDPVTHLSEYFGRATERQTLYCWYMNHKWADADVPWHYAPVMFAVTVPVGLHLLGVWGAAHALLGGGNRAKSPRSQSRARQEAAARTTGKALWFFNLLERPLPDGRGSVGNPQPTEAPVRAAAIRSVIDDCNPRTRFLLLNVVWPLVFFALPGITVYDGTRLFLMVFPLWAILIGQGGAKLFEALQRRWSRRTAVAVLTLLLAGQSVGLIHMHPLGLSYYNALVGGLRGAVALGFEPTYWGDSVTRSLLDEVSDQLEAGQTLDVAPVLHPFQLDELRSQSPALRERNISLRAYDDQAGNAIRTVLVIRRRADSWTSLTPEPNGRLIDQVQRSGVQLTGVYELQDPAD